MKCRSPTGPTKLRPTVIAAALVAVSSFAALAQETGSSARGLDYAKRHCAECHGVEPDQEVSPIINIAPFKEIANTPGMTPLALKVWFESPHPNMPLLVLAPDDRDDVVAYITSLREKK